MSTDERPAHDGLPTTAGFVGLGHMGEPMARRLAAAGVTVRGYDPAPGPREALDGVVTFVDDVAGVADGSTVVVLMLPDSNVVEAVVDGGLLDALAPGTLLVDMSSSVPLRTQALAERVASRGVTLIDAPVSGGVRGAVAGTMAIMVGGPADVAAGIAPFLGLMGKVRHVGPVGAGHALKSLNNLMSAAHLLASSEAILVGERFGLDPEVMLEAVNGSSGRSVSTETKWPNHILPGTYDSGFTVGLLVKDVGIAIELAGETGSPTPLTSRVVELWREAVAVLGPDADHTEIARWLRGRGA